MTAGWGNLRPTALGAANLYALGAIGLWALLATLAVALKELPPFLLTGLALVIGSVPSWPLVARRPRLWVVPPLTLAIGVGGLFGFHFLLFIALRLAPSVEVNLVNYLWPLFIVVLAPLVLPTMTLRPFHLVAASIGFAGAAVAILGGQSGAAGGWSWGYLFALASALIWASYSLLTRRVAAFPTAAVGLFGLVSGALSLLCHMALEPAMTPSLRDWQLLLLIGLGPLGAAFYLWDRALKLGDPRQIGILSYLTPLSSTVVLMLVSGRALTWSIAISALMIVGAALIGTRVR